MGKEKILEKLLFGFLKTLNFSNINITFIKREFLL